MRNNRLSYAMIGVFAVALLWGGDCLGAEEAATGDTDILDNAMAQIRQSAVNWSNGIQKFSLQVFLGLALISFAWNMGKQMFDEPELSGFFNGIVFWMIITGSWLWLLKNAPAMMFSIVESFQKMAADAGGGTAISPSQILGESFDLFSKILKSVQPPGYLDYIKMGASLLWNGTVSTIVGAIMAPLTVVVIGLVIVASTAVIVGMLMLKLANAYLLVYTGYFFLAFAGAEWTRPMARNYLKSVITCGVELFCTLLSFYLFAGVAKGIMAQMRASVGTPGGTVTIQGCLSMLLAMMIVAYFVNAMPKLLGNVVNTVVTDINTPFSYRNVWTGVKWTIHAAQIAATGGAAAAKVLAQELAKQVSKMASGGGPKPLG